jgi:hypothetical protein
VLLHVSAGGSGSLTIPFARMLNAFISCRYDGTRV